MAVLALGLSVSYTLLTFSLLYNLVYGASSGVINASPSFSQDGSTPYSLAVSGQHPETANFVMTHAAKSPKKEEEEGPSRLSIFDMEGQEEVEVINFGSPVTKTPAKMEGNDKPPADDVGKGKQPAAAVSAQKKSVKDKKKGKKEKEKEKEKEQEKGTHESVQLLGITCTESL